MLRFLYWRSHLQCLISKAFFREHNITLLQNLVPLYSDLGDRSTLQFHITGKMISLVSVPSICYAAIAISMAHQLQRVQNLVDE